MDFLDFSFNFIFFFFFLINCLFLLSKENFGRKQQQQEIRKYLNGVLVAAVAKSQ